MDSTCTLSQQLISDIGHFIGVTLEKEKLSPSAEKRRSELHQSLQPFIIPEIDIPEEEYEDPAPIRVCSQLSTLSGQSDDGSKINITLNELRKYSPKYGPLWRKERALFRDVWRKYLAGIHDQKLILFYSEKDPKPTICVNIQGYVARHAPNIQGNDKKKGITFEVICPGKKDYQFFARTAKDMEQWVAVICQTSIQHIDITSIPRNTSDHRLVISTDEVDVETYDEATPPVEPYGEEIQTEEEFYDDIAESKHTATQLTRTVPDRPPIILPTPNKKDSEDDEEEEIYNDVEEYEEPSLRPDSKPAMWHVERKFDIKDRRPPVLPPTKSKDEEEEEEEEIYHDIAEYQRQSPPKVVNKPPPLPAINQPPPLPARRPLPSIPKDEPPEEELETYEDINTSIQSPTKHSEHNLQFSENKKIEEDFEETYDDIGNSNPNSGKHLTPNLSVSGSEEEEVEEIYDDVGDTGQSPQTKNQFVLTKENTKSIANIQNSHYNIGEIKKQGMTSVSNEKEPLNITINVSTKDTEGATNKKLSMQETKMTENVTSNKGNATSFLQRNYLVQNGNTGVNINVSATKHSTLQNEIPKQTTGTSITKTKEANALQNEAPKLNTNVKNISSKFNQPKNNSFLHRHSSQEETNVQSILQKLRSKNSDSEGNITSTKSNSPSSQFNRSTAKNISNSKAESPNNDVDSEKNSENFQNAFKKIEASLAAGNKPMRDPAMKMNLPTSPNKTSPNQSSLFPSSKSPTNTLKSTQNRPLPPKPTDTPELSFNASRTKSPMSRAPELPSPSSETASRSSTMSRNESSLELPVNRQNSSSSIQISVSPRQLSPMLPRKKPNLADKPEKLSNKSMNIKVTIPTRNSSESSKISPSRPRNRPNGLPVSIPNVPDSPTSEPPKLPPRPKNM